MSALYVRAARKAELPLSQKRVLMVLCETCTDAGECDVLQRALAHRCALPRLTVQYTLHALQKRGYVQIKKHPRRPGNLYRLTDSESWCSPAALSLLFHAFPSCSLLKLHAASIHERP